jgi:hypothetical protein
MYIALSGLRKTVVLVKSQSKRSGVNWYYWQLRAACDTARSAGAGTQPPLLSQTACKPWHGIGNGRAFFAHGAMRC